MSDQRADVVGEDAAKRYRVMVDQLGVVRLQAGHVMEAFGYRDSTDAARESVTEHLRDVGLLTQPSLQETPILPRSTLKMVAKARSPISATSEIHGDGTKTCPECAESVQAAALMCHFCGYRFDRNAPGTSTSGIAVTAFICSLLGLWIAAVPLGIYAQRQIDQSSGRVTGRGLATAGVVIGFVTLIATVIVMSVFFG